MTSFAPRHRSRLPRFTCLWTRTALAIFAISVAAAAPCTVASTASVESGPHYAHMFGQQYRTKTDLYIFIFNTDTDHVYIGSRDRRGLATLPPKVDDANVGRTFGRAQILAVLPAGSVLTLLAETHETLGSSGLRDHGGIAMGFIARATHADAQFEGVLTEFIQTAESAPGRALNQRLDPSVVEPIK